MSEKNESQNPALIAVGCDPDVMLWRNQTGVFRSMDDPRRIVTVGTKGAPDSLGVVSVTITPDMVGQVIGVAVAAEFKTKNGRQSENQKNWQAAFEKRGGRYALIRSADEMVDFVAMVKRGE